VSYTAQDLILQLTRQNIDKEKHKPHLKLKLEQYKLNKIERYLAARQHN
jgi:hypothetical protein